MRHPITRPATPARRTGFQPFIYSPRRRKWLIDTAIAGMVCLVLAGCGASKDPVVYEPGEEQRVEFRISDTQDARLEPDSYRALFVEGSAPDDKLMQEHQKYSFYAESVEIDGDTATATVVANDAASGEQRGKVQWKLQRVGDKWLISDAPLP